MTGAIYVGNDTGVYVSTNQGVTWAPVASDLPNAQVIDLEYNPAFNLLGAGTHGRGAFLVSPTTAGATITAAINGATQVSDDAGLLTDKLTITRVDNVGGLTIFLSSSDPSAASLPASITIPDGQYSVSVDVTIHDSALAQFPESIIFTAVAGGAQAVGTVLDVLPDDQATEPNTPADNDTPAIAVNIGAGAVITGGGNQATYTATVSRNTPTTSDLTVTLINTDPLAVSIPATVTIPAGQSSATFTITALDHFIPDITRLRDGRGGDAGGSPAAMERSKSTRSTT